MEKLTTRQVAALFMGSFLGAGFVSGQELLQFFGVFGMYGVIGLVVTMVAFYAFCYMVMRIARNTGIVDFEKIIIGKNIEWLRKLMIYIVTFFLFGILVIMVAGAGALVEELLQLPAIFGNLMMCVLVGYTALSGAKGVIAAFDTLVPLMVITAIIVSVFSGVYFEDSVITASASVNATNPLIGNWFVAAITYISSNILGSVAILIPISQYAKDEKSIKKGCLLGGVGLFVIAVAITLPIMLNLVLVENAEMPMLTLARAIHPILFIVYAILLFGGIYQAALSCLFAAQIRIRGSFAVKEKPLLFIMLVLAFGGSIIGFKSLVSVLYPICGYLGLVGLIGILLHYRTFKKTLAMQ